MVLGSICDLSPTGKFDYGYNITRRITGSGMSTSVSELTYEDLLDLRAALNDALMRISQGTL